MATPLEESLIYQKIKAHVFATACDPEAWIEGDSCEAPFATDIIIHVFGRAEAEQIALMWQEAGRSDIAGRVKEIIHRLETKQTHVKKETTTP